MGLFSWCETGKGMGSMCSLLTALGSQYCHVILGTRAGLPLWNTISPASGNLGHSVCGCSGYVCKYIGAEKLVQVIYTEMLAGYEEQSDKRLK